MGWLRTGVILAAGTGSRLREVLQDRPKGFLQFGFRPIIEESLNKLVQCGIHSIVIVAGYRKEFYQELAQRLPFLRIVENPRYETTGSMYSLLCARHLIREDFLLLEGDLIYEIRALVTLQNSRHANSILLSRESGSGDEVFVGINGNAVTALSKDRTQVGTCGGELVGISRISLPLFHQACGVALSSRDEKLDYEACLSRVSHQGAIRFDRVEDLAWCEIDDPVHEQKARRIVYPLILEREKGFQLSKTVDRKVLLNPGPATTTDSVKLAMVTEDICPREPEICGVLDEVRSDLVRIIHGEETHEAVFFASSGTGAVEACLSSVVPPGKKVLIINNGAYGQRMQAICDAFAIPHVDYNIGWGSPVDLAALDAMAKRYSDELSHIAFVHHETSTGLLNPLAQITRVARAHGLELIVDAMSSFAGIPLDVRKVDVDYLISTSNKCIQGMPGLSFVLCKKSSLEKTGAYQPRSFYFNLFQQYTFLRQHRQMQFTVPLQVLFALRQAVHEYFLEGEQERFDRYTRVNKRLQQGMKDLGFKLLVDEEHRSNILLAIAEPEDSRYDFQAMHDFLLNNGFTIYPGKGGGRRAFRLATMGALNERDIDRFLEVLREYLSSHEISLARDHATRAVSQ